MKRHILLCLLLLTIICSVYSHEHDAFVPGNRLFKPLTGKLLLEPVFCIFADTDSYFTGGSGLSLSFYQFTSSGVPDYSSDRAGLLFPNSLDSVFKFQHGIYISDALSIFLDEGGFQLETVDFIYGVFTDFKIRFLTLSIRVQHHCGNRSTGLYNDQAKIDTLYTKFYSLESLQFYIDAEVFRFRPYFGISMGRNLYGGGSYVTEDNNVINLGLEYNQDFPNIEWLTIFSAVDMSFDSLFDFTPSIGLTAGAGINAFKVFIKYYNGINQRGVFYGNEEHVFCGGFYVYF